MYSGFVSVVGQNQVSGLRFRVPFYGVGALFGFFAWTLGVNLIFFSVAAGLFDPVTRLCILQNGTTTGLLASGLPRQYGILSYQRERAWPGSGITLSNPLNQPGALDCRWIVGATSGATVVPNPYRLQAGNADDTTSFENYPMFHTASLDRATERRQ
jgi:hypothetical protein